jgi:hypothetical protein
MLVKGDTGSRRWVLLGRCTGLAGSGQIYKFTCPRRGFPHPRSSTTLLVGRTSKLLAPHTPKESEMMECWTQCYLLLVYKRK